MSTKSNQNWIQKILIRWFVSVFGLWIAAQLLDSVSYNDETSVLIWAGLALSVANVFIRPIIIFLAIPAILLTLGIFMVVVNGFMIYLVGEVVTDFEVATFWGAILAGLIVGLVNYAMSAIVDER